MSLLNTEYEELLLLLNGAENDLQIMLAAREEDEDNFELLSLQSLRIPGQTVTFMVPAIENMLKLFGFTASDITKTACVNGPGSFTGLRLALAAGIAIAEVNKIPIAGLEYLPILAFGPCSFVDAPLWVITHARRAQVYIQGFRPNDAEGTPQPPLTEALPVTVEQAAQIIAEKTPGKIYLSGSGLNKNKKFFDEFSKVRTDAVLLPKIFNTPGTDALISAAVNAHYSTTPPEALYLRGSDAEENLSIITKKRGISEEEARRMLDAARS
jgi:tRNA threonylcarbamoyl adenosine modification protein YeaZ